jgi:hypothetical protein
VNPMADSSKAASGRGDFYVQEGCCTACGVPQLIAPELVGWTEEKAPSCYWIRQPESPEEVDRAIKIIQTQELGCHRYAGNDPAILERLPREDCDFLCPEMALRHGPTFGPSEAPVGFSLSASREAEGVLNRLWRRVVGRGGGK